MLLDSFLLFVNDTLFVIDTKMSAKLCFSFECTKKNCKYKYFVFFRLLWHVFFVENYFDVQEVGPYHYIDNITHENA